VEELLASRRQRARAVLLASSLPEAVRETLSRRARAAGVPCLLLPREEIARRVGEAQVVVAAEAGEFAYAVLEEWLDGLEERAAAFVLDGVTDPGNFGAVLRSARAFGVAGVVTPKDRSCPVTGTVFRASAGSAAHVPVVLVTNLARALRAMKERGFWVFAADARGETLLPRWRPAGRTAVVFGSEGRGIRRLVREGCDGSIRIPMAPGAESLNVAVAAGIVGCALAGALTGGEAGGYKSPSPPAVQGDGPT